MNNDFTNSGAGKTILRLVARGNAIIAEILKLAAQIPKVFEMRTMELKKKYGSIILDFAYLDKPDFYVDKIDKDEVCFLLFYDSELLV